MKILTPHDDRENDVNASKRPSCITLKFITSMNIVEDASRFVRAKIFAFSIIKFSERQRNLK